MKKALSLCLFAGLLILISCNNIFENSVNENSSKQNNTSAEEAGLVNFSGSLQLKAIEGAVPSEVSYAMDNASGNSGRSAIYGLPDGSDYEYFIQASSSKGEKEIIPTASNGKITYSFQLETGVEWTFKAGYRKKADGEVEEIILLQDIESSGGNSYSKTFSSSSPSDTHTFVLSPKQTSGKSGKVNLPIAVEASEITGLEVQQRDGRAWLTEKIDVSTSGVTSKNDAFDIPSGSYALTFIFYKGIGQNRFPAYITYQTVNVYDNLETKVWVGGFAGGGEYIISNGSFKLTDNLVKQFAETTLYVGKPAGLPDDISASDTNAGGPYAPLETLGTAINRIAGVDKAAAYQIYVSGEQKKSGGYTISSSIDTSKATSILIQGLDDDAQLNADQNGSVLTVESTVPLTLKNIQLTGGNAENGGGLNMASGTKVTLEAGTLIGDDSGDTAASGANACANYALLGGGIYCQGDLTLKSGSSVSYNYANDPSNNSINAGGGGILCNGGSLTIQEGAKVSLNGAVNRGGGIGLNGASFTMTGGEISGNKSKIWGGGIHVGNATSSVSFVMSGGRITGNSASGNTNACGGGIFYDDASTFVIKEDALIDNNTSIAKGAGVNINNGTLEMQGGEISGNYTYSTTVAGGAVAVVNSNGTFKMSGSAYIPYGATISGSAQTGTGRNDVYLVDGKTITLADDLSSSNNTKTNQVYITPALNRGTIVLSKTSSLSAITDEIAEKFALTTSDSTSLNFDESWETIVSSDAVSINSPFYVGKYGDTAGADNDAQGAGTKTKPYKTIAYACSKMDNKDVDYIIKIIGNTNSNGSERQEIPDTLTNDDTGNYHAKSIKLMGFDSNAVIDRGLKNASEGSDDGTALLIDSKVPVYISKLKITGGYTSFYGGGININANNAKVYIQDGVVIESNKALLCGGGILNNGSLYISGGEIKSNSVTKNDTVYRNQGTGGGLVNNSYAEITGGIFTANTALRGGAITAGSANTILSGDVSVVKGSGSTLNDIYVMSNGKLDIPADLSKHNNSTKKIALITEMHRGEQVLTGDKVSGNYSKFDVAPTGYALESSGKLKLNQIVKDIYVNGTGTGITPGTDFADNVSTKNVSIWNNLDSYNYNSSTSNESYPFASIDMALKFITFQNSNTDYTIYVTGTVTNQVNITSDNNDTNSPIKLIKGTNAKSIKITGKRNLSSSDSPQDIITSGKTSDVDNGYTVYIYTDVPVTFEKINIQGGKSKTKGGGIWIANNSSDVTLGGYTFVHDNKAKFGAGVYNIGKLTVNSNAKIYSNTTVTDGNDANKGGAGIYNYGSKATVYLTGGEIYLNNCGGTNGGGIANFSGGSVFVYGGANIGILDGTTEKGNTGSGIYNAAYLYLGYKSAKNDKTPNETQSWTGSIQYNSANSGAGINNAASSYVYMKSGTITANKTGYGDSNKGTGVFTAGTFTMTGGSITSNRNSSNYAMGGGVYIESGGTFDISTGATISGNSVLHATGSTDGQGGAIYNAGTLKISGKPSIPVTKDQNTGNDLGEDYNDIYLASVQVNSKWVQRTITVGELTGTGSIANVTLSGYTRGLAFLEADDSVSDITQYKGRFTLNSDDDKWNRVVSSDKKKVYINGPIHVKSSSVVNYNGLVADKAVQMYEALNIIKNANNSDLEYELIINGQISRFTLDGELNDKAKKIYIHGNTGNSTDIIKGLENLGAENYAMRILTSVPVTLENIKITGGKNSSTDHSKCGGGINIQSGANVTLSDGVLVTENVSNYGAGIYNNGTLTITGSGTEDSQPCIIQANATRSTGNGGGIYNEGTLKLEGYAKFINNTATSNTTCRGGAIYNDGNLEIKDNVEFPSGSKQTNDIYLASGKKIKITGEVNSSGIKVTAANRTENTVILIKDDNFSDNDKFSSSIGKFALTSPDTIIRDDESNPTKGLLVSGLIVEGNNVVEALIGCQNENDIRVTLSGNSALNGSDFTAALQQIHNNGKGIYLDARDFTGNTSPLNYKIFNNPGISEVIWDGHRISFDTFNNCSDLETLTLTGEYFDTNSSGSGSCGFRNGNGLQGCSSINTIQFTECTQAVIYWAFTHTTYVTNTLTIYLPESTESVLIQIPDKTTYSLDNLKIVYAGSETKLRQISVSCTRSDSYNTVDTVKFYYNNSTSESYTCTWKQNSNKTGGSWQ